MIPFNEIVVKNIENIITVSSPKGRNEKITNRPRYGLSFCLSGQITYTHNGSKVISDTSHAIILPQGQTYTLNGDKSGIFPVINFTCDQQICDTVISIPIQNIDPFIKDYEQIKALSLFEGNRAKIMSIFYNILHRLYLQTEQNYGIIEPAVRLLENNYANAKLSNADLANACNISEIYFRKLFTRQYGITPHQYIIDIRIQKAKQLLSGGTLKISAITEMCGFTNQYHFCRVFKEKTGLTPTGYMKQNRIYKI